MKLTIINTKTFANELFGDLTVLTHADGSLWFIGNEVCEKLGYSNPRDALSRHCKGVVKHDIASEQSVTGKQQINIIPERDVYRLVMRSKLPTAEKFEEFVVSEVLPSIRKTGGYGQSTPTIPTTYAQALQLAANQALELEQKEAMLLIQKPKVEAFDTLIGSDSLFSMNQAAKVLGWGRNKLFAKLRDMNILMKDNTPYQKYRDIGYFDCKDSVVDLGFKSKVVVQTFITTKGQVWLSKLLA